MRLHRAATVAALLTIATAAPIGIGTTSAAPSSDGASGAESTGGHDYVVVYDTAVDAAVARESIAAAGGTIVDEYSFGVARVAADQGFAQAARQLPGILGVARNQSIGGSQPGMPHKFSEERPLSTGDVAPGNTDPPPGVATGALKEGKKKSGTEPFAPEQWGLKMINAPAAQEVTKGAGVLVGVIDTGIDGSHPDLAPNFDATLSRNFTVDKPDIDGPCQDEPDQSCNDPANVDEGGHGSHVAGIIAAAENSLGIEGVAPEATLVNVRAGQDSGYFFLAETVAALNYAAVAQLDVVNMSFYTDPWLYNCASINQVLSAPGVSPADLAADVAEQAAIRAALLAAVANTRAAGVTLVAAAGNSASDLAAPTRTDATSPDYPVGTEYERTVTKDCLDLPSEAPGVIQVSSLGPSASKSDFSNYGQGAIDISAPGGWFRDGFGTKWFRDPGNMILSSYPEAVAHEEGGINKEGGVTDHHFYARDCVPSVNVCGYYQYLQGTSMASPHVAGVVALIIAANGGSMSPDAVAAVLADTATDHACPVPPTVSYVNVGRPASWDATCTGTLDNNGFYGEGIVNAAAAVS